MCPMHKLCGKRVECSRMDTSAVKCTSYAKKDAHVSKNTIIFSIITPCNYKLWELYNVHVHLYFVNVIVIYNEKNQRLSDADDFDNETCKKY